MQKSKWQIFRGHRLVYCFFFLCVLEFGQHSWLTEDLIRGHTGHETGSCHPPMGTSLGLYSLGLPRNKGSKHDNEERLVLLFAGFLSFPPFFGQRIPTRERSFLLFSMSLFFQPHHMLPVIFDRILLLDVYSNGFIFGTQYKGRLLLAISLKAGTANGVSFAAAENGEVTHPWLQSLLALLLERERELCTKLPLEMVPRKGNSLFL